MADISDVERGLVSLVGSIFYPNGNSQPSILGTPIRIFRGWPIAKALDEDMKAGRVCISISPLNQGRDITAALDFWESDIPDPSIQLTIEPGPTNSTQRITISGTIRAGDAIGIRHRGIPYVIPVASDDTLNTLVIKLRNLIPDSQSDGPSIILPYDFRLEARSASEATSRREIRRTVERFRLIVWASTPSHRDEVGKALDNHLSGLDFLTLPNGEPEALLRRQASMSFDDASESRVFRRDIITEIEFATYEEKKVPVLLFGVAVSTEIFPSVE